jgi:hypothetical protein
VLGPRPGALRPDCVGDGQHDPVPVAGLDARGLEDQVATGHHAAAHPVVVLVGHSEGDDAQPEHPQPRQLAVGQATAVILAVERSRYHDVLPDDRPSIPDRQRYK